MLFSLKFKEVITKINIYLIKFIWLHEEKVLRESESKQRRNCKKISVYGKK